MAYTQQADLSTGGTTAFDRIMYLSLRPHLHFDQFATVRPSPTHRGGSVQFTIRDDLAAATTPLTENTDVTPTTMGDSNVTVTLQEYGATVTTTAKLRGTDFTNVDVDAAEKVGWQAGLTLDTLARTPLVAGTNVTFVGQATQGAITATDTLTASAIRAEVAALRGDNVMEWSNGRYVGLMHPDQSVDLREDAGAAGWVNPADYSDAARRWNGMVGAFEGVDWIESSRVPIVADAGAGNVDVYQSVILGQECLAKAYSENVSAAMPQVRRGPVVDSLSRFETVGFYWLGGYARFREAAIRRVESASSIGDNA